MTQEGETQERVKRIERWLMLHTSQNSDPYVDLSRAFSEIRFLLSLLDSQAVQLEWSQSANQIHEGAITGTIQFANRAATAMRDACVAKVKVIAKRLTCTCIGERADHHAQCPVTIGGEMVSEIQSLTLDQVKQEAEGEENNG